jgi:hypothetical protein
MLLYSQSIKQRRTQNQETQDLTYYCAASLPPAGMHPSAETFFFKRGLLNNVYWVCTEALLPN